MVDKGIPVRLVLYGVAFVYLFVDLIIIGGPLRKAFFRKDMQSPEVIASAKAEGVVARVYYQSILLSQVDRRVEEELWKEGKTLEDVKPESRKMLRMAALNDLIDLHLLRIKARYSQREFPVSDAEIDAGIDQFTKRFATEKEFQDSLARHGWTEKELRFRIAARLQQQKYLEGMIEIEVSEEEAKAWFESNKEKLAMPERLRARHIFISTLGTSSANAKKALEAAKTKIESKKATFEELAASVSNDRRSKDKGGDLGWMHAKRLAPDFAAQVFALKTGKLSLLQTKIGWHLVEVLERKPAAERTYAEAHDDVIAALEAVKRDRGLMIWRKQLRERDKHKVEIFMDVLERGLEGEE